MKSFLSCAFHAFAIATAFASCGLAACATGDVASGSGGSLGVGGDEVGPSSTSNSSGLGGAMTTGGGGTTSTSSSTAATTSSETSSSTGTGGAPSGSGGGGGSTSSASVTTAASTGSGGAPACALGHLVISEIRSRGIAGANDDFIELYNATGSIVALDATWLLEARSNSAAKYTTRWKGAGQTIPAYGHFLIGGTAYVGPPAADDVLSSGVTDASSVRISQNAIVVDAVCYATAPAKLAALQMPGYTCEGTPMSNAPHDDSNVAAQNVDVSIERKPGGANGNCTDSDMNSADFVKQMPSTPENTSSPPTP